MILPERVGRRKRRAADAAHQSCVVDPQPDRTALIPALHATLHAGDAEKIVVAVLNSSQIRAAPTSSVGQACSCGRLKTHPEPASRRDGQGTVPTLVWADDLPKTLKRQLPRSRASQCKFAAGYS